MSANPIQSTNDQERRDRCMSYLLGEMTAEQSAALEAELDHPEIAAALDQESALLLALAKCEVPCPAPASDRVALDSTALQSPSPRSLVAVIAALAAVVLVAIGLSKNGSVNQSDGDYELELAKTWVEPAVNWSPDDIAGFSDGSEQSSFDPLDETASDDDLQWMVAAVQASLEEQHDDS